MEAATALTLKISELSQPVVTSYQIGLLIFEIYDKKTFRNQVINDIRKEYSEKKDFNRLIHILLSRGVLQESTAARSQEVFSLLGSNQPSPEEIACSIDPFAYVSHMSAMEWHGLTDRFSKILFVTSPDPRRWQKFAHEKMTKDLGGSEAFLAYRLNGMPLLRKLKIQKVGGKIIHRHSGLHLGAFISPRDKHLRISTVGRTFLDMIRQPDLCGGIYHVIEVYEHHAERFLQLIVDEIDRHGTKIDKVRVGYLLQERGRLVHPIMEAWVKFAQRGGSRKLYAQDPYSSRYSEKWCLSLNIEE